MFGFLSRGVSAFVASVSGAQKDETGMEGSSTEDSRSVKSTNSSLRRTPDSSKSMAEPRQRFLVETAKENNLEEIVQFLIDNFTQTEAILSNLNFDDELSQAELRALLRDLVGDGLQCPATCVARDRTTQRLDGVAIACKTAFFDRQVDRLCAHQFSARSVVDVVEFLRFVFNKLDVTYYLGEHNVTKPTFVALVCVRKELWNQGIGTALMNHVKSASHHTGSDGLISLCSNFNGNKLMSKYCSAFASVRYDVFKGEHRHPPIVMPPSEKFESIVAMITKFA